MLAMDMATGKSRVAVDWIQRVGAKRVLLVASANVVSVWPDQFEQWAPGAHRVIVLAGTNKQQTMRMLADSDPGVFIVTYGTVWRNPMKDFLFDNRETHIDAAILDESHRIKSAGSKVSKFFAAFGRRLEHRLCLTGTPAPNSRLDLYGQFRFLDPTVFGTNYNRFANKYAVFGGFEKRQLLFYREEMEADMRNRFYSLSYRVKLDDVLDVPPYVPTVIRSFQLGKEAFRVYKEMEKDSLADLQGATAVAGSILTKMLRLQQVTSGFIPDDTGKVHQVDTGKINAFKDLLEDLSPDKKVVVFCLFVHDIAAVKAAVTASGRKVAELSGKIKELDGPRFPEWADVLVVQQQSGSEGIDLTAARYCVFYSLGYSRGVYDQCRARLRRPGQTRPVATIHINATKTVDTRISKVIDTKGDLIRALLDK